MKVVNVHEAKTRLSKLLQEIEEKGETFLICRNGVPVADLIPHAKRRRTEPHPTLSQITIQYDPTEDLTPDEWREGE